MQRIAVITGAAQGIGRKTAQCLTELNYFCALNDLRDPADTLDSLHLAREDSLVVLGDVSDEAFAQRFAAQVQQKWGRADLLVNNAGISSIAPAETVSGNEFRRVLEINLLAPFLLSKAFGQMMLSQGHGSIVNIASIAGLSGISDRAAYNCSKHGLLGLTRTLAAEWGGRGVRVNAVCPGWVKTEMDATDQAGGSYTDQDITNRVPMGRFASPDDIAKAVAFLADERQSGFINGHALVVDGGWTCDASWESLRLRHR
jgi:NAD(P)-dependent dehydrogenase (short-subunit alcohol dehydrogenase family)